MTMLSRFRCARDAYHVAAVLVALAFVTGNAIAQGQIGQIAPGHTALIYNSNGNTLPGNGTWRVTTLGGSQVANDMTPNGWVVPTSPDVINNQAGVHITVPSTATPGQYNYSYVFVNDADKPVGGGGTFLVAAPKPGPAPGPAYSWEASVGGVNTANGNKMTTIPITGFTVPGGMSISLALTHNSQMGYSNFNGQKWTFSYLDFVVTDPNAPHNVTMYWGDGRSYTFVNTGGTYQPPVGIYDTLTVSGSNSGGLTYLLKTQNQVSYQFSQPGTGTLANYQFLTTITDQNANKVTVGYAASTNDIVQSVADSYGRALSFTYTTGATASPTAMTVTTVSSGRSTATWTTCSTPTMSRTSNKGRAAKAC